MTTLLEGLISSRRRPSRSRSDSGKQLHSRWGDATITAPNGGWSQQEPEGDLLNPPGQARGGPDSRKRLPNNFSDLTSDNDEVAKVVVESTKQSTLPAPHRGRSAIVITIPLPWSRKTDRRSYSVGHLQAQDAQKVDKTTGAGSQPEPANADIDVYERTATDAWPLLDPLESSYSQAQVPSLPNDYVDACFAHGRSSETDYGPVRLPQIQTGVAPAKSQPVSAVSALSPVAETFNGRSESNNVTPIGHTPIAQTADGVLPAGLNERMGTQDLTTLLDTYLPKTDRCNPSALVASPTEAVSLGLDRMDAQSTCRVFSRSKSRGREAGGDTYMRNPSRNRGNPPGEHRAGAAQGRHRSASGEPRNRTESIESMQRKSASRQTREKPTTSPSSREHILRSDDSLDPLRRQTASFGASSRHSSRKPSREPEDIYLRSLSPRSASRDRAGRGQHTRKGSALGLPKSPLPPTAGSLSRAKATRCQIEPAGSGSPSPDTIRITRRAHSQEEYSSHLASYPGSLSRGTGASRRPATSRRVSVESGRRAASVEPIRRRVVPRDNIVTQWATPATRTSPATTWASGSSFGTDGHDSADDSTDIDSDSELEAETELAEIYFESRKGWNGAAGMKGVDSKGFYGDVIQDYKTIARDVEAKPVHGPDPPLSARINIVNMVANKKDRDKAKEKENGRIPIIYGGPELVPSHEELWG